MKKFFYENYGIFIVLFTVIILLLFIQYYSKENVKKSVEIYKRNFLNNLELVGGGISYGYMQWDEFYEAVEETNKSFLESNYKEILTVFKYISKPVILERSNIKNDYQFEFKNSKFYIYFNIYDSFKKIKLKNKIFAIEFDYKKCTGDIIGVKDFEFGEKGEEFFIGIKYRYLHNYIDIPAIFFIVIFCAFEILLIRYLRTSSNKTIELDKKIQQIITVMMTISSDNEKHFLKEVFNTIYNFIPESDYGSITYFEEDKWTFLDGRGYDIDKLNALNLKAEYALKPDEVVLVENLTDHDTKNFDESIFKEFAKYTKKLKSSLFIPLKSSLRYYGTISLDIDTKSLKSFSKESIELLKAFSNLISSYFSLKEYNEVENKFREKIIISIIQLLEIHDSYTKGHSENVAHLSSEFARYLELSEKEINDVYWAGLVHDIGKIVISSDILNKKEKLSNEDFDVIKMHPSYGYYVLQQNNELSNVAKVILYHHERYDGKGYPEGLAGDQIPLLSRIISLADTFDAITSKRSYRDKMSDEYAYDEISKSSGTQFDGELAMKFIEFVKNRKKHEM